MHKLRLGKKSNINWIRLLKTNESLLHLKRGEQNSKPQILRIPLLLLTVYYSYETVMRNKYVGLCEFAKVIGLNFRITIIILWFPSSLKAKAWEAWQMFTCNSRPIKYDRSTRTSAISFLHPNAIMMTAYLQSSCMNPELSFISQYSYSDYKMLYKPCY